jgi:hypothetical protein
MPCIVRKISRARTRARTRLGYLGQLCFCLAAFEGESVRVHSVHQAGAVLDQAHARHLQLFEFMLVFTDWIVWNKAQAAIHHCKHPCINGVCFDTDKNHVNVGRVHKLIRCYHVSPSRNIAAQDDSQAVDHLLMRPIGLVRAKAKIGMKTLAPNRRRLWPLRRINP